MIRLQVQLTEAQLQALRQLSASTGKSTAELVRNGVDQLLAGIRTGGPQDRIERAIQAAGKFAGGAGDVSAEHDRYLAEAFRE